MSGLRLAWTICLVGFVITGCFGGGGGPNPPQDQIPQPTAIPWAMPGGNSARTAQSELYGPFDAGTASTPVLDWEYTVPPTEQASSWICSSPVVDREGNSYMISDFDVFSVDPSGQLRWRHSAQEDLEGASLFEAAYSPLLLTDNLLVAANGSSRVWAFNLYGDEQWTVDLTSSSDFQLSTVDDKLAIANGNQLFMLDMTGNVLKQTQLDGRVSPDIGIAAAEDGTLLIALNDGSFAAYDTLGEHLWSYTPQGASIVIVTQPPGYPNWHYCVAADGLWLIPTRRGMIALQHDGSYAWEFAIPNSGEYSLVSRAPAVTSSGTILLPVAFDNLLDHGDVPLDQGMLYALDAGGNVLWKFTGADFTTAPLSSSVESVTVDGRGDLYLELVASVAVLDAGGNLLGGFNKSTTPTVLNTWGMALGPDRQMLIGYTRNWLTAHKPPSG